MPPKRRSRKRSNAGKIRKTSRKRSKSKKRVTGGADVSLKYLCPLDKSKPVLLVSSGFSSAAMQETDELFAEYCKKYTVISVQYDPSVKDEQSRIAKLPDKLSVEYKFHAGLAEQITAQLRAADIKEVHCAAKSAGAAIMLLLPGIKINSMVIQAPAPFKSDAKLLANAPFVRLAWSQKDDKIPFDNAKGVAQLIKQHYTTELYFDYQQPNHQLIKEFFRKHL